jgi:signal peptidase II
MSDVPETWRLQMTWSKRARVFWPLLVTVLLADCTTKELADAYLQPEHVPREVIGTVVRFTLAHNPYAAMSLNLGSYSRVAIPALIVAALFVLLRLYRETPPAGRLRAAALGLIVGGALGNLGSRLASSEGVTDFIDIGLGNWRFFTFNVADIGVFCGALLLIAALDTRRQPAGGLDGRETR